MIQKNAHWFFPRDNLSGLLLAFLYYNRFSELLVYKPGETFLLSFLATLLAPLVTSILHSQLPLSMNVIYVWFALNYDANILLFRDGEFQNSLRSTLDGVFLWRSMECYQNSAFLKIYLPVRLRCCLTNSMTELKKEASLSRIHKA